jgi:hypothetical protein
MSENYNGKVQNASTYIKNYTNNINTNLSLSTNLWTTTNLSNDNQNVIIPASPYYSNLYIPGNLYLDGNFINASDIELKTNIETINNEQINNTLNLKTYSYTFKDDPTNKLHFGLIAQEVEENMPNLVINKPNLQDNNSKNYKGVNYLEMIPLLLNIVQKQQKEINLLQTKLNAILKNF